MQDDEVLDEEIGAEESDADFAEEGVEEGGDEASM